MIVMKWSENQIIIQLKAQFLDILNRKSDQVDFCDILQEMLYILKNTLQATEVTLYNCDSWNGTLYIEASTNKQSINARYPLQSCFVLTEQLNGKRLFRNKMPLPYFENYHLLLPLDQDGLLGYLLVKGKDATTYEQFPDDFFVQLGKECYFFMKKAQAFTNIVLEELRYKQLYRVTSKFHTSMDMAGVLGEIIETLQEVYPSFTYIFLLSQDSSSDYNLPIKDLPYEDENTAAMQAYLTGTVKIEKTEAENQLVLYAPLKGRQGIYGILQVIAPDIHVFPSSEVKFIELLAHTGGNAMENAQLYQQSKRLIADLQLINEISHRLNSNLRLNDSMTYMSEQIISAFAAEEVGFILFSEEDALQILPGSTSFFLLDEATEYIEYMAEKVKKEEGSFFIGDLGLQECNFKNIKYRSIMGVPMVEANKLKGFAIVTHQEPYHFSFESFRLLQSLIHHSTLAVTNSMLHEELKKMVITDYLTKLYSRSYLDDTIQLSLKNDAKGTFALIDIDDFKVVNDTFGHQVGDKVLIQVAKVIKDNIRDSDTAARWGGEELAVYLPKTDLPSGYQIASRILKRIAENTNPKVTVSIGVSYWKSGDNESVKSLFQRADKALYVAKRTGKNKVVIQQKE